jgi:UTP--glucose-1-phosphate uridylyltransferase
VPLARSDDAVARGPFRRDLLDADDVAADLGVSVDHFAEAARLSPHEVVGNIICVEEVPPERTASYGIITPGERHGTMTEVRGLVEKPKPEEAPSTLGIVGRYILQPEVMRILDNPERGAGGEIQLTDAMARLIGTQPFHGVTVSATRYDCGDKAGFITANLALALERDDVGPAVRAFLADLR